MYLSRIRQLIYLIFALVGLSACRLSEQPSNAAHIAVISKLIKEGDIVFRRGEGVASRIVLAGDSDGEYSHIGMVVLDSGLLKIAHSVPGEPDFEGDFDRVKIDSVSVFFSKDHASKGAVMRLNLKEQERKVLTKRALEKVSMYVRFDHDYNLQDTTKLYCTEFIRLVYLSIGVELSEGRRTSAFIPGMQGDYIMPSDIFKNRTLKLVYSFN